MVGGAGADAFVFTSKARSEGVDRIMDFNASEGDVIQIKEKGFDVNSTRLFTFQLSTGELSFDGQQIATLENIASNADFKIAQHVELV